MVLRGHLYRFSHWLSQGSDMRIALLDRSHDKHMGHVEGTTTTVMTLQGYPHLSDLRRSGQRP